MRAARIVREQADTAPAPADAPDAVEAAPPAKARGGARAAVVWGSLGFLTGAVFWHAVGFWGFISEVVLNGAVQHRGTVAVAQAAQSLPVVEQPDTPPIPTVYLVEAANCTALALNRPSNRTQQVPCPPNGLALRLETSGEREDLARLTPSPTLQTIGYRREVE